MSVLFVDLVGFTTLSERRDAEEVHELLAHYFDTARQVGSAARAPEALAARASAG